MRIFLDKVSPSEFGIFQENFADFLECDDTSSFTNMKGRTLPEHLSELVGNFFGQNDIKIEIGPWVFEDLDLVGDSWEYEINENAKIIIATDDVSSVWTYIEVI